MQCISVCWTLAAHLFFFVLRILPSKLLRGSRNPQRDEYEANEEGTFVDIDTSDKDIYVD